MPLHRAINHVLFPKQSLVLFTKRRDFRLIHFDRDGWLGKSKLWLWPTDSDGLNRLTLNILIEIVFLIYFRSFLLIVVCLN
jgi:hypothetical protein